MGVKAEFPQLREPSNPSPSAAEASEVPSGYKRTEFGIIPEDWPLLPVRRMGEVLTGKALAVNAPGAQRPYLRTKNVFDGRIDIEDVLTMPMTDAQFEHFKVLPGDVLLNEGQSLELVGRCAMYQGEYPEPCAIQNQLLRFRARAGVSPEFACQLFRYCQQTGVFARVALQTTSIAHLGGTRFERLLLHWPENHGEQCAIADSLSDADKLIDALEMLTAKKRAMKLGSAQQLLTGKIRLPGFGTSDERHKQSGVGIVPADWEVKRLGDFGRCYIGLTFSPERVSSQGHFVLRASNIGDDGLQFDDKLYVSMPIPDELVLREQDLLICVRNGSRPLIGKCALVDSRAKGMSFGAFMSVFRSPRNRFVFHYFQSEMMKRQIHEHLGATINQITNKSLNSFHIALPPEDEQDAIATVLFDMDAEILALERQRTKAVEIKQAMMQQLLTGRIRLV